jgi:lysophospholipase
MSWEARAAFQGAPHADAAARVRYRGCEPPLMELVATPDNPRPPGAVVTTIRAADGVPLRVARWHPAGAARGAVAICTGRAEFVEKYFEVVRELLDRRLAVVAFDWRGQGLSGRELDNARKGHIDDFSLYERDLEALAVQALAPFCPRPWFALGHSMGAAVLLLQSREGRSPFDRLVLTSPMIGLRGLRRPLFTRFLAEALDIAGFGAAFVPGGGATAAITRRFESNILTSDEARYRRSGDVVAACPAVGLGDPTIGWVNAAFRCMRRFEDPEFPLRTPTPILVVASGGDRLVDTRAVERFATRLKAGKLIVVPHAEHEILMERDVFREQFWAAFDAFVPGTPRLRAHAPALAQARQS